MKKVRMNIFHSRFILSKLKIFGEIVTTFLKNTISLNNHYCQIVGSLLCLSELSIKLKAYRLQ